MISTDPAPDYPHVSVLYHEIINALIPQSPGLFVDCTLGAGGHAFGILDACSPDGKLLGLDLDPKAIAIASERLSSFPERFILKQDSFSNLTEILRSIHWSGINGILLDLGVSSMQFDTPDRGFSFLHEGPLDMRLNPGQPLSAAEIVNEYQEEELANILWKYGEENQSRKIARAIVRGRPITTTIELAAVIAASSGHKPWRIHPATRSFQALRIAVNNELGALETTLPQAVEALIRGGRLAVISFHSLEDRIVKQYFRRESKDCVCPPEQPFCTCGHKAIIKDITRHPITPAEDEIQKNSRSRSAKLRVIEKI